MERDDDYRLRLLGQRSRGAVLDIGCHDNQNPYLKNVIGFDLRKPKNILENYSDFVLGDCEKMSDYFEGSQFDTLVAGELIEHLECPASFLREAAKMTKDDGTLLVTTPNPYHWTTVVGNLLFMDRGLQTEHINLFPYRAMVALLKHTGWRCVEVLNASGGMRLWHTTRSMFMPCPKAIAWQLLYVCKRC